jgi:tRNA threonylcarbamoyladenosine biosynthesis protein TsaB
MTSARYVLGIDTSTRLGSIALAVDGAVVQSEPLPQGGHSSGLSQAGERLLAARALRWKDLAGVAVSEGPGSFTGLRIGLAWAKGICLGSGLRLVLVSAHEAGAYRYRGEGGFIATVLPGEKGEVHGAFWASGRGLTLFRGPEAVPEGELATTLSSAAGEAASGRVLAIASPDLKPHVVELLRLSGHTFPVGEPPLSPAGAVAELGDAKLLAGQTADLARSAPAYGRSPNARKPTP